MATIGQILAAKNNPLRPSFYTQNKEGIRYPSIIRAFLKSLIVTSTQVKEGFIKYEGQDWKIHLDSPDDQEIMQDIAFDGGSKCVISFQQHKNGYHAVVRKFRDKTKQERKDILPQNITLLGNIDAEC